MTPMATSILGQAGQDLGAFIPRLGGAIALLLIGLLLTRLLTHLLRRGLEETAALWPPVRAAFVFPHLPKE